jgi:glyoxylase-like metal-dependent hydrolase (beta-lactamase superfamily II)
MVFVGDTLFQSNTGRTDLRMGSFEDLEKSIKTRLYSLPDNTIVYTGHGPNTTIGSEKRYNPFVRP